MAISLAQSPLVLGTWSGSFGAAVGAGDTVLIAVTAFTTTGAAISSSAPLLGGATPAGTTKLAEQQSGGTNGVYTAIWMLPNVTGGETSISITVTNANTPTDSRTVGITCYDISGLGSSPALDLAQTATAASTSVSSGTIGPLAHSSEFVLASVVSFGSAVTPVGSPWTESYLSDQFGIEAYQITSSSGGSYSYTSTNGGAESAGAIVAVYASAASSVGVTQSAFSANGSLSATFASGVTQGNSIVAVAAYDTLSSGTLTTSSPTLGGTAFSGAQLLLKTQSPNVDSVYLGWWLLPDIPAGLAGQRIVSLAGSDSSGTGGPVGLIAWEVYGLGATPVLDRRVASVGSASAIASGSTLATASLTTGLAVGAAVAYGSALTAPGSPWTTTTIANDYLVGGYQTLSTGATPSFTANTPSGDWVAGVLALASSVPSAQGWRDFVTTGMTTTSGVDIWTVNSVINGMPGDGVQLQVLSPTSPNPDYPHSFLFAVDANAGFTGLYLLQSMNAHNQYNLTVVTPGYNGFPSGYADNPINPQVQYETYTLEVVNWVKSQYGSGGEKVYLMGMSKAGLGSQALIFRNPTIFQKAASWDFPAALQDIAGDDPYGNVSPGASYAPQNYGTNNNYQQNYELSSANLTTWRGASNFTSTNRLWVGGYANYGQDVTYYLGLLSSLGIRYIGWNSQEATHDWHADWAAAALVALFYPSVGPQMGGPV